MSTIQPVDGRTAARLGAAFYLTVAAVALAGQTGAAMAWLHWPLLPAAAAVAALELGGVTLAAWADFRQRLGERAIPARVLSGAVAVFAVVFNALGHGDRLQAAFFAGMSALGYGVWLIQAGARRRDQLRALGMLPAPPPVYGLAQWIRRPWLTRRARGLAVADPTLGLYGSLAAASVAMRTERRQAAIAKLLRRKLSQGADPLSAEIAVTTFDLDEVAARLAAGADYDGLTALLAADLAPARLTARAALAVADTVSDTGSVAAQPKRARRAPTTAQKIAALRERKPDLGVTAIARKVGVSERTVTRHLAALAQSDTAQPVNGAQVPQLVDAS